MFKVSAIIEIHRSLQSSQRFLLLKVLKVTLSVSTVLVILSHTVHLQVHAGQYKYLETLASQCSHACLFTYLSLYGYIIITLLLSLLF